MRSEPISAATDAHIYGYIYPQSDSPGTDKEANWLPAPANGPFNLTVRIYWPTGAVLNGTYRLPPVRKMQ